MYKQKEIDTAIQLYDRGLYHTDMKNTQYNFNYDKDFRGPMELVTVQLHLNLSRCYIQKKNYRSAIKQVEGIVTTAPNRQLSTKAKYLLGIAYFHLDEYDKSELYFREVTQEDEGEQASIEGHSEEETTDLFATTLAENCSVYLKRIQQQRVLSQQNERSMWKGRLRTESEDKEEEGEGVGMKAPVQTGLWKWLWMPTIVLVVGVSLAIVNKNRFI